MADDRVRSDRPDRWEDDEDDRPRRRRRRRYEDEDDEDYYDVRRRDDGINALIPYKNPKALAGYYLGVFSLIPCAGLFLGPAALTLGILGFNYQKRYPTAGGLTHAIVALVLGSLTTLANWSLIVLFFVAAFTSKR